MIKRFLASTLLLAMILALASPALSKESSWYVGVSAAHIAIDDTTTEETQTAQSCTLGISLLCTNNQTTTRYRSSFSSDTPFVLTVGENGITSDNLRIELQLADAEFDVGGGSRARETLEVTTLKVNVWHDFEWNLLGIHPYAGGGLGLGKMKQGRLDNEFAVAQLGVGVNWSFMENVVLDFGYRWFISEPDLLLENDNRSITRDINGDTWQIGLRYQFARE